MKVILLKDIPRIGKKFQVMDVPDGHALNFLIPRGLALRATPDAVARIGKKQEQNEKSHKESEARYREMMKKIAEEKIVIIAEANEQGGLFRSIHLEDILKAFAEKGYVLKAEEVSLQVDHPVKSVGEHTIGIAIGDGMYQCVISVVKSE